MDTKHLFSVNRKSSRLNESLGKKFGNKINLESFDLPQLEDTRNKLRTQISQVRQHSGFNETLENDSLLKAQFMLDAINAEIAERELIVDALDEDSDPETEATMRKIADSGDDGYEMIEDGLNGLLGGEVEILLQDMYDNLSKEFRISPDDNHEDIIDAMMDAIKFNYRDDDRDEGGETDDDYALKSAGFGSDEDYGDFGRDESVQGDDMRRVTEGEIQQASAIVTAKTMVDRVGRWIEELSGMENETLLQLGDSIRDEMGMQQSRSFIEQVAPAIQTALETLKTTRESLSNSVNALATGAQEVEMLGAEPGSEGDMMEPTAGAEAAEEPEGDEFAAAEPAAGGAEAAGREQRESVDFQNRLLKVLAG